MKKSIAEYKKGIEKAIDEMGPYSHNIVSMCLRSIDTHYGRAAANQVVTQYELDDLFDIHQIKGRPRGKK